MLHCPQFLILFTDLYPKSNRRLMIFFICIHFDVVLVSLLTENSCRDYLSETKLQDSQEPVQSQELSDMWSWARKKRNQRNWEVSLQGQGEDFQWEWWIRVFSLVLFGAVVLKYWPPKVQVVYVYANSYCSWTRDKRYKSWKLGGIRSLPLKTCQCSFAVKTQSPQQPTQLTYNGASHYSGGGMMPPGANRSVKTMAEEVKISSRRWTMLWKENYFHFIANTGALVW